MFLDVISFRVFSLHARSDFIISYFQALRTVSIEYRNRPALHYLPTSSGCSFRSEPKKPSSRHERTRNGGSVSLPFRNLGDSLPVSRDHQLATIAEASYGWNLFACKDSWSPSWFRSGYFPEVAMSRNSELTTIPHQIGRIFPSSL